MCGIAGFVVGHQTQDVSGSLRRMTAAISHRGPDDEGFYEGLTGDGRYFVADAGDLPGLEGRVVAAKPERHKLDVGGGEHRTNAAHRFGCGRIDTHDAGVGAARPDHRPVEHPGPLDVLDELAEPRHHLGAVLAGIALAEGVEGAIVHPARPYLGPAQGGAVRPADPEIEWSG